MHRCTQLMEGKLLQSVHIDQLKLTIVCRLNSSCKYCIFSITCIDRMMDGING